MPEVHAAAAEAEQFLLEGSGPASVTGKAAVTKPSRLEKVKICIFAAFLICVG